MLSRNFVQRNPRAIIIYYYCTRGSPLFSRVRSSPHPQHRLLGALPLFSHTSLWIRFLSSAISLQLICRFLFLYALRTEHIMCLLPSSYDFKLCTLKFLPGSHIFQVVAPSVCLVLSDLVSPCPAFTDESTKKPTWEVHAVRRGSCWRCWDFGKTTADDVSENRSGHFLCRGE